MAPLLKAIYLMGLLIMCACPVTSQYDPQGHNGTTANIQQVFQGRCWDYEVTRYLPNLPRVKTVCSKLWELFVAAFSYKGPCDVKLDSYQPFFTAARQEVPTNKTLFWSGVFHLAHDYGNEGQRYITLEDTLIGYLANSITWCGQVENPGLNMVRCPAWSDCSLEAAESFWAGASTAFAREASGEVTLMLGGSNPNKKAYRRDSFFSKYELPNLSEEVTSVSVIVSHVLDMPKMETCKNGSLLLLEADVKSRGLSYACEDDPLVVMHLLCSQNPQSRECQIVVRHQKGLLSDDDDQPRLLNQTPNSLR